jgi:hypothetical protein
MTVDKLKEDIKATVENNLLDSMMFYTQEYQHIMPKREILKEFFIQVSRLCYELNKEEEDCD